MEEEKMSAEVERRREMGISVGSQNPDRISGATSFLDGIQKKNPTSPPSSGSGSGSDGSSSGTGSGIDSGTNHNYDSHKQRVWKTMMESLKYLENTIVHQAPPAYQRPQTEGDGYRFQHQLSAKQRRLRAQQRRRKRQFEDRRLFAWRQSTGGDTAQAQSQQDDWKKRLNDANKTPLRDNKAHNDRQSQIQVPEVVKSSDCRNWMAQGSCQFNPCRFRHGGSQTGARSGDRRQRDESQVCFGFRARGECKFGQQCKFSHGQSGKRARRMAECKNWMGGQGTCYFGQQCKFIHGQPAAGLRTGWKAEGRNQKPRKNGANSTPLGDGEVNKDKTRQAPGQATDKRAVCRNWKTRGSCTFNPVACKFRHESFEAKPSDERQRDESQICFGFREHGTCGLGARCEFAHERRMAKRTKQEEECKDWTCDGRVRRECQFRHTQQRAIQQNRSLYGEDNQPAMWCPERRRAGTNQAYGYLDYTSPTARRWSC